MASTRRNRRTNRNRARKGSRRLRGGAGFMNRLRNMTAKTGLVKSTTKYARDEEIKRCLQLRPGDGAAYLRIGAYLSACFDALSQQPPNAANMFRVKLKPSKEPIIDLVLNGYTRFDQSKGITVSGSPPAELQALFDRCGIQSEEEKRYTVRKMIESYEKNSTFNPRFLGSVMPPDFVRKASNTSTFEVPA